jgi:hypothetical protein
LCRALPAFMRNGTPSQRLLLMNMATAAKVGVKLQGHATQHTSNGRQQQGRRGAGGQGARRAEGQGGKGRTRCGGLLEVIGEVCCGMVQHCVQ